MNKKKLDEKIIPGAEGFSLAGHSENGKTGVLLIHGYTGSPQHMRYLGEQLHQQGFTVEGIRLTGHGSTPEAMEAASYQDWIEDAEAGLKKLQASCDRLFVAGISMGGGISLYLALHHALEGVIPINAAVGVKSRLKEVLSNLRAENKRFIDNGVDIKKEGVEEISYRRAPVKSMEDLIKMGELVKPHVNKIQCPLLVITSKVDNVITTENSHYIYENAASKEKHLFVVDNSYHIATLDHDAKAIADRIALFMKEER